MLELSQFHLADTVLHINQFANYSLSFCGNETNLWNSSLSSGSDTRCRTSWNRQSFINHWFMEMTELHHNCDRRCWLRFTSGTSFMFRISKEIKFCGQFHVLCAACIITIGRFTVSSQLFVCCLVHEHLQPYSKKDRYPDDMNAQEHFNTVSGFNLAET